MWKNFKPYDESIFLAAREKHRLAA